MNEVGGLTASDQPSPVRMPALDHRRVSAEDLLRTLDLYIKHQKSSDVARALNLTSAAVAYRMRMLGVQLRRGGQPATVEELNGREFLDSLRHYLQASPPRRPVRSTARYGSRLSAADVLRTVELYQQYQTLRAVGERLGISLQSVSRRLQRAGFECRPMGAGKIRFEDANGAAFQEKLKRLRTQAAV
jgi:hypothetical protein